MKTEYITLNDIIKDEKGRLSVPSYIKSSTINCVNTNPDFIKLINEAVMVCKKIHNFNIELYCGNNKFIYDFLRKELKNKMDFAKTNSHISIFYNP